MEKEEVLGDREVLYGEGRPVLMTRAARPRLGDCDGFLMFNI